MKVPDPQKLVGNAASLEIEVFRKENPKLCEIMGV